MTAADPTRIPLEAFEAARRELAPHVHHTPLLRSRTLDEATGYEVRLKAELFQRTGSYKIRGALNKLARLTPEERERGVVCSSAGNHAQGVALAAALQGVRAVVVMAENATPAKIAATRAYGAEVVLHGRIWDEANARAQELVTLDEVDCVIDGLRVQRPGANTFQIVQRLVDEIVTLPDVEIFAALVWTMERCKLVPEGAAAAPIAALLGGLVQAEPGARVVAVITGGNLDLDALRGLSWN